MRKLINIPTDETRAQTRKQMLLSIKATNDSLCRNIFKCWL